MVDDRLEIFYQKKYLVRSIALYFFSLVIWIGIYCAIILPKIISPHPYLNNTTVLVSGLMITIFFLAWTVKLMKALWGCMVVFGEAPSKAYILDVEGVQGVKPNWKIAWAEILDVSSSFKKESILVRYEKRKFYTIENWGIDPAEFAEASRIIHERFSAEKIKR